MEKIKVLMVLGGTSRGGAETFAMNTLRMIDRDRFQVDFAVNEVAENGYTQEIYAFGSKIHRLPFFKVRNWFSYVSAWNNLLKENHYDIVHGHVSSSAAVYLKEARRHGCKTIVHSHSAGYRGSRFEQLVKKLFTKGAKRQADYWFACSNLAAKRVFGSNYAEYKHYYDMPNAIITDRYLFDLHSRDKIRESLGLTPEQRVYGHVGSFDPAKNHDFLLDVFAEISRQDPSAVLLLAGNGKRREEIKARAELLHVTDKLIMAGNVDNVNEYMMAMDVMIFPSFFEGFPISVLEAQATGLPVVLSDTITDEVLLTPIAFPMSLNTDASTWAKKCMETTSSDRIAMNAPIASSRYNMKNCVKRLMGIYEEMLKK